MIALLIFTASYCFACALISGGLLAFFVRYARHPLGHSITFLLMFECLTMVVAGTYSTLSIYFYIGIIDAMPPISTSSIVRIALATACAVSTIHLMRVLHRIMSRNGQAIEQ